MKRAWLFFLLALSLLAGCKEEKVQMLHLKIASPYELINIDPQKIYRSSDYKILQAAFEGLVVPDPETMLPLPGIAERWTISPDGMEYKFFLRDNARWSDGTPVTADDFVFAVKRALSSKFACASVEVFFSIKNAKEFFNREMRDFSKVGIHAINSRMLLIELESRNPHFMEILTHPCWLPLNPKVVETFKEYDKGYYPHDVFKTKIISNGPFLFSERIPGTCILLQKNDDYWDAENVLLEWITFSFFEDQVEAIKHFSEGETHLVEISFDGEEVARMHADNEVEFAPSLECVGLMFNTANPTFKDKDIRRALSIVINREELLRRMEKDKRLAAYRFIPPLGDKYTQPLFRRDVELAKKILAEAGYGPSNRFPDICILISDIEHPSTVICMEQIQKDWETCLGIRCHIEQQDLETFFNRRKTGKFDAIKMSCGGKYRDPALTVNAFASWDIKNYGKWQDNDYDAIISKIATNQDFTVRGDLVREAELRLINQMPVAPLYFNSHSYLVKSNVSGWFTNISNVHPAKFIYFEK
ncbi:MAG: peptide ABC transporter substrate-binding protein [Puniceicoccales bacterium]|jgi:oligopeptide transport system substrate-binding protein|nr:peptide ABC transporter substrate-binding protein [Puniceicoccales bacterium]